MLRKLIILRKDIPAINKTIGDVIDSIPITRFEGNEVIKVGETFVRVYLEINEELEAELLEGEKKLKSPDIGDPFYQELLSTGKIEVTQEQLEAYIA